MRHASHLTLLFVVALAFACTPSSPPPLGEGEGEGDVGEGEGDVGEGEGEGGVGEGEGEGEGDVGEGEGEGESHCGDGVLDVNEACDDHNHDDGDGCEHDCTLVCGAGSGASRAVLRGDGSCVLGFGDPQITWAQAEVACEELHGHLAVPRDDDDNARLSHAVITSHTWLGLNDIAHEAFGDAGAFTTVAPTHDPHYRHFRGGEPSNTGGNENCVEVIVDDGFVWNDAPCDLQEGYLCEIASDPCGDGTREVGEQCDDGGIVDGDGCNADCTLPCGANTGAARAATSEVGTCFVVFDAPLSWVDARAVCQSLTSSLTPSDLATPRNVHDNGHLAGIVRDHTWLGVQDRTTEAGSDASLFHDASDEPLSFTNFADGEPNNFGGDEDCGEMRTDALWNDNNCATAFAYACELPL